MPELYSGCSVLWKAELANNEIEYLAEDLSKQNVKEVAYILLPAYNKRSELKMELLYKREPELKNLKNSQPVHIV